MIEARGKLYVPAGATASTHILKLPSQRFRGLAQNELVTRLLASLRQALPKLPAHGAQAGLSNDAVQTIVAIARKSIRRLEQALREKR